MKLIKIIVFILLILVLDCNSNKIFALAPPLLSNASEKYRTERFFKCFEDLIETHTELITGIVKTNVEIPHFVYHNIKGDLNSFKKALLVARLIDFNDNWIGGETIIVVTGDLIDMNTSDPNMYLTILNFFETLEQQGAAIVSFLGEQDQIMLEAMLGNNVVMREWIMSRKGLSQLIEYKGYVKLHGFKKARNNPDLNKIKDKVINRIYEGKMTCLYIVGDIGLTHGGILPLLSNYLKYNLSMLKEECDEILIDAIHNNLFPFPIFKEYIIKDINGLHWALPDSDEKYSNICPMLNHLCSEINNPNFNNRDIKRYTIDDEFTPNGAKTDNYLIINDEDLFLCFYHYKSISSAQ